MWEKVYKYIGQDPLLSSVTQAAIGVGEVGSLSDGPPLAVGSTSLG